MRHGEIREVGPVGQIFAAPKDAYTRALLACRPRLDSRPRRLPVIDDIVNNRPIVTEQRKPVAVQGPALIEVTGLRKEYKLKSGLFSRKVINAVQSSDFVLHKGRTLGVVGESGSGKTTIGMMLTRLTQATGGCIMFEGEDLAALSAASMRPYRRRIQIIFQNPDSALNRAQRVRHILSRPLSRLARLSGRAREAALAELARGVRLGEAQLAMRPRALSGGLKQRVAIASAFAGRPRVVICDEPTSALDVSVQAAILNLLADLQRREQVAYVFITHDLAVVRYLADRIAVMYLGQMLEIGPAAEVLSGPHHPYTAALVSAATSATRIRLRGEIPVPGEVSAGCIFQKNCPRKIGVICETVAPAFDPGERHPIRCHLPKDAVLS